MRRDVREVIADWLMLLGALALLGALFLPWSHQLSRGFAAQFPATGALRGVPREPTAWQVYSIADVGFAVLVAALLWVAALGGRVRRIVVLIASGIALAFAIHANAAPPTSGTLLAAPVTDHPTAGRGETVAIFALSVALVGVGLSFTAD